jgi:hypothetical protein
MEYVDEVVPEAAGVDDPLEQEMEESVEQAPPEPMEQAPPEPMEQAPPEQGAPMEQAPPEAVPEVSAPTPRIRKVRVTAPTDAPQPPHVYWPSRLQEHRDAQRAEKNERYANLRLM